MKKIFNIIIENGIIISLFLGLAYLLTFQYQKGKITYYGIQTNYIDLSLGKDNGAIKDFLKQNCHKNFRYHKAE